MSIEIFNCEQNSPEWFECRRGIPTASNFQSLMAKSADRKGRATYMRRLAAERITGEPGESFTRPELDRGHAMEPDAANLYSFLRGVDLETVGFIRSGDKGCSPDRLIGSGGVLEIKTQRADLLIETLMKDEFPAEHVAQTQGCLWVTERDYADIIVYYRGMPPMIKRAKRDVRYIAELAGEVARFNDELDAMVEKIKAYGLAPKSEAA